MCDDLFRTSVVLQSVLALENAFHRLQSGRNDSQASNQVSHQAIGGDTLLYNADDPNEWLDSVKNPHHWRAIKYKGVRKMGDLPGLEKEMGTGLDGKTVVCVREMLKELLKVSA